MKAYTMPDCFQNRYFAWVLPNWSDQRIRNDYQESIEPVIIVGGEYSEKTYYSLLLTVHKFTIQHIH